MKLTVTIAVAFFIVFFSWRKYYRREKLGKLMAFRPYWTSHILLSGICVALALCLFSFAIGRTSDKTGRIFFLLDISSSMNADFEGKSRLEAGKKTIASIAGDFSDCELCLISFGGSAFVDFPPSFELDGFLSALAACQSSELSGIGTSPGRALQQAEALSAGNSNNSVAILVSDCEVTSANLPEEIEFWKERRLPLFTICCGEAGEGGEVYSEGMGRAISVPAPEEIMELCKKSSAQFFQFISVNDKIDRSVLRKKLGCRGKNWTVLLGIVLLLLALWLEPLAKFKGKHLLLLLLVCSVCGAENAADIRKKLENTSLKDWERARLLSNLAFLLCRQSEIEENSAPAFEAIEACKAAMCLRPGLAAAAVNLECALKLSEKYTASSSATSSRGGKSSSTDTTAGGEGGSLGKIELGKSEAGTISFGTWRELQEKAAKRNVAPAEENSKWW